MLIPESNVKHLMLRADVVAATEDGKFHVHAVRTVDEAIELLTGVPAGERTLPGEFAEGSVNGRVATRLREFSAIRQSFAGIPTQRKLTAASRRQRG